MPLESTPIHADDGYIERAELTYQAERASQIGPVNPTPDYIIDRYRRCRHWRLFPKEFMFRALWQVGFLEKEVLDFGCGTGEITTQLARFGARLTAIDISPDLINIARQRAEVDGVTDRVQFLVGDLRQMVAPKKKFDFLISYAVLHHVDIHSVFPALIDRLKPDGTAVVVEPIALSPLLQRFRNFLPIEKDASPGERQLNWDDLRFITEPLSDVRIAYFNLLGRLARLFPNANKIDKGYPFTKAALVTLNALDRLMLNLLPSLSRFAGTIVIVGRRSGQLFPAVHGMNDPNPARGGPGEGWGCGRRTRGLICPSPGD